MELSMLLAEQILVMAVMMFLGFAGVKLKLLDADDSPRFALLVLYVIGPCMVIDAFQITFTKDKMYGFLLAVLVSALMHVIFLLCTRLLAGPLRLENVERASIIYTNSGNLIVPLIGSVLGKEYVFYCCAFITVQTILIWTHGVSLICGTRSYNLKKILINPNILSMLLGLVLFFTGTSLPSVIGSAVERTGDCIAPVSMIVVGMLIASADLKKVFFRPKSWMICLIRLILIPVLCVALLRVTGLCGRIPEGGQILLVPFLAAAAPAAVNVTQIADVYHKDSILACSINILSVFLCILTMPLMTWLYLAVL